MIRTLKSVRTTIDERSTSRTLVADQSKRDTLKGIAMGQNLPSYRPDTLTWLEAHLTQWNDNLAAIGLTSAQTIDLALDIASARTAFTSVQTIRADAKAETQAWYTKANTMHTTGSDLVTSIKAFAANSDDAAAVYLAAGMTEKDPPSPVGAPTQPVITTAILDATGSVTIKWDGTGPVGTVYIVSRKLATESVFSIVGQGEGKEYTDTTIPNGTASALYTIKGVRGTEASPDSGVYTVLLGNLPAGAASQAA